MQCGIPIQRPKKLKKEAPRISAPHPEPPQVEEFKERTKPLTHNLVICGATNPGCGQVFGDFLTVCHALMGRGIYGDFISCFPIEDHFDWLQREEPEDCVDGTTAVSATNAYGGCLAYTREEYDTCPKWWHQTGPFEVSRLSQLSRKLLCICWVEKPADLVSQMAQEIWQWIAVKAKGAIPGDVVNIVVCGRGDPQRLGFYAGHHRIFPFDMDKMLGTFKQGVTVNVISGVGHSDEDEWYNLNQKGQSAQTKRPKPFSEGVLGLRFSRIAHSLGLRGNPLPPGNKSKA